MKEKAKKISGMDELDTSSICYWKVDDGTWLIYFPKIGVGGLKNHSVEEHEDGTISVYPSILTWNNLGKRHGFLRCGEWEEV